MHGLCVDPALSDLFEAGDALSLPLFDRLHISRGLEKRGERAGVEQAKPRPSRLTFAVGDKSVQRDNPSPCDNPKIAFYL